MARLTITLPDSVHQALKEAAARRKTTIGSLISESIEHYGIKTELTAAEIESLQVRLHEYTPRDLFGPQASTLDGAFWSVKDLERVIQRWYGVVYKSRTTYRHLFALCGFSYQRPARVFRSRRETDVAAFEELVEKT